MILSPFYNLHCINQIQICLFVHLQVLSVYIDLYISVDVRKYSLHIVFFVAFVWGCATFAVLFYGVDSVDRQAGVDLVRFPNSLTGLGNLTRVDLENTENFQWIHVSQLPTYLLSLKMTCLILLNRGQA